MSNFQMNDDYIGVDSRVLEFRKKHPEGSIQQHDLKFMEFGGKSWIVYTAAAYRTPDDPRPGMGTAWEQVPGKTPFTRDSELQNAETAAWGRALIAAGAADARKGIASREEVQNRAASNAEFIPSEEANSLMRRVRGCTGLEQLAEAWKSVEDAMKRGVIDETEFAVLKGQANKRKKELEHK